MAERSLSKRNKIQKITGNLTPKNNGNVVMGAYIQNTITRWIGSIFLLGMLLCLSSTAVVGQDSKIATLENIDDLYHNMEVDQNVFNSAVLNKIISVEFENKPLLEALSTVAEKAGLEMVYNSKLLGTKEQKVNLNVNQGTVEKALWRTLEGTGLRFAISAGKQLVLMKMHVQETAKEQEVLLEMVTGAVTDATSGEPLPGVNVVVKGTTTGTSTDSEGEYELNVPSLQDTLVFSFIGYQTQEIPINGRSSIEVALQTQAVSGDELVVVGYGTQRRSDVTGSISSVQTEGLEYKSVSSLEGALQGQASGVFVRQSGGALDGDFEVSIRGVGSVTGDSNPLYVVDDVPLFSGDLSTINQNDIESIEILKDASATAIYGARAANGVVLITTKSGVPGTTNLTFRSNVGFEKITKTLDQLSTEQQRQLFVEAFKNSGLPTDVFDDPSLDVWKVDNDWQELITRTALRHEHNVSLSGGNESTTYSVSGTFLDREGVLLNTDINRYSVRANLNHSFNDRLDITARVSGSQQEQNVTDAQSGTYFGGSGTLRQAIFTHSYAPYKDDEGNFIGPESGPPFFGNNTNPVARRLEETRTRNSTRMLANFKIDFDLTDHLTLTGSGGGDIVRGGNYSFLPVFRRGTNQRTEGSVNEGNVREINAVGDVTLRYSNTFSDKHSVEGLIGGSIQQFEIQQNSISASGTQINQLDQVSNQSTFNASGSEVSSGLMSQFFRINYNYDDRYLLTGTVRRDGSSKFGPENRYGFFPSASVGWRISNEQFMSNDSAINELMLRISYGLTGNQSIGDFQYLTRVGSANYVWGDQQSLGGAAINLGNPNLQWEASEQFDVGIELGLYDDRVNFTLDFYDRKSRDLLIQSPIPLTAGVSQNPTVNLGSVLNRGIEFSTITRNLIGEFSWTTNLNFTYNKNEVLDIGTNAIGEPLEVPGQAVPLPNDIVNLTKAGQPVGAFYMWEFDGIWQLGEEEEADAFADAVPGDVKYVDHNGNGRLDNGDRIFAGSPQPKYFGGMTNTFQYQGLSLSASLSYAGGHKLFNGTRNLFARSVPFVQNLAEVADFWTPENPSNKIPRPAQGGDAARTQDLATAVSTRFLEDASYIRLSDVTLSFDFPERTMNALNLGSSTRARIIVTGRNLVTITEYSGYDPEANTYDSLISAGQDMTPFPLSRIYTLGVELSF
ncbi:TonB-dependent receptor [Halalkalibaculum sp. DA3122]|uniref:TonB-dependent receptor n=1 Tax=unclassified Halalkalibaculum TaxID=2964617 RepID=UPI003754B845